MAALAAASGRAASRRGAAARRRIGAAACRGRIHQPPGRGGRDRHVAGRSARDDAADRSLRGEGMVAGASQLRCTLRSGGEGTRGPYGAVGAEAVFAERRKLDY
jgi:hypothetical protein